MLFHYARVALTLKLVGGHTTAEIARAYLVLEPPIAQRLHARVGPDEEPVLLMDHDRTRWDPLLIRRGLAALDRAESMGGALGPYTLQAAITACRARAHVTSETNWVRIAALYDALSQVMPTPVVELNRAVAVGMAFGPAAGLEIVDSLRDEPTMKGYHLLPSVRADLLAKLGHAEGSRQEWRRAAELATNVREKELLLARASGNCSGGQELIVISPRYSKEP